MLLSPHKPWQGIDDGLVWESAPAPSRRAMQAAVCEAGWEAEARMPRPRAVSAREQRGRGREGRSLDWT